MWVRSQMIYLEYSFVRVWLGEVIQVTSRHSRKTWPLCRNGFNSHNSITFKATTGTEILKWRCLRTAIVSLSFFNYSFVYNIIYLLELKATFIYPATERDIEKYSRQTIYMLFETPEDYKNITLKYLEESDYIKQLKVPKWSLQLEIISTKTVKNMNKRYR